MLQGAKTETYAYTDTNRLSQAVGPWGTESFVTDGVGNRTGRTLINTGGTTTDIIALASGSNRLASIATNGTTSRTLHA